MLAMMLITYLEYILDGSVVELAINKDQVGLLVRDDTRCSNAVLAKQRHFTKGGTRNCTGRVDKSITSVELFVSRSSQSSANFKWSEPKTDHAFIQYVRCI